MKPLHTTAFAAALMTAALPSLTSPAQAQALAPAPAPTQAQAPAPTQAPAQTRARTRARAQTQAPAWGWGWRIGYGCYPTYDYSMGWKYICPDSGYWTGYNHQ
jgi:hypothetical protein